MWIQKTKNGYRMYDRYEGMDGKIHRASVPMDRDTPQAQRKAREELAKIIAAKSATVSEMRLKSLTELYLSHKDIKPSTMANYNYAFKMILEALGDVTLDKLTAPYIMRQLTQLRKPQTTINRYILILNNLLDWSYQLGYLSERIYIKQRKLKEKKRDPELEYLERDELTSVLDQLEGTMYYYACKFLALTGCRFGEMAALTLADLDDKYIHITKAYKLENGVSSPKTEHSVRDIYIQPELRAFLSEYYTWRKIRLMELGVRTDLLFFGATGSHLICQNLARKLRRCKCSKHLHPHIFRHTHVALLAEQGVSLEAIARRLGHSDSVITSQVYFHVTQKLKDMDEQVLNRVSIL